MTTRRGEPLEAELGERAASAMARRMESDLANMTYQAVPVGRLSRWLWRFIHYRIERFGS